MKKYITIDNILIICAFGAVLAGIGHPYFIKYFSEPTLKFNELGQIGDWFGGLSGPLIGLSSFILVFIAFRLQNKQLKNQQNEFERQNKAISLQRFENSFFQLLSFQNEIVQTLWTKYQYEKTGSPEKQKQDDTPGAKVTINSTKLVTLTSDKREYFSNVRLQMQHNLELISRNAANLSPEMRNSIAYKESVAIENYKLIYEKEQAKLGHYFRHLYHIVKYVHISELIEPKDKQYYVTILRAQLSAYELVLLTYNCLVEGLGYKKFKFLVDHYDLLQNMNRDLLLDEADWTIFKNKTVSIDPFTKSK